MLKSLEECLDEKDGDQGDLKDGEQMEGKDGEQEEAKDGDLENEAKLNTILANENMLGESKLLSFFSRCSS